MYYLIQFTWGLPLNIIGFIVYIILSKIYKFQSYKYRKAFYVVVPWNFGGVSLGIFIIHGEKNYDLKIHEYGHSIQNLIWGWLMPVVIAIPSAIRYWYRKFLIKIGKTLKTSYYDIWFEKQATELGTRASKNEWSWI